MKTLISSAIVAASLAGAAQADTILTTTFNSYTFDIEGDTFTGAFALANTAEFDVAQNVYAKLSLAYVTAGNESAFGFDGSVGYLITNDINPTAGTGSRFGVGATIAGDLEVSVSAALAPDFVFDARVSTPINDFGAYYAYDAGVEYTPLGIYVNASSAQFSNVDASIEGFGIGYRTRF